MTNSGMSDNPVADGSLDRGISEPGRHEVETAAPETSATGIEAITTTMQRTLSDLGPRRAVRTLLRVNQPAGFDCPGCAWPEPAPGERKTAEFCENGAKAIAEEAMTERLDRRFFVDHHIDDLRARSDHWLGRAGRLTEPVIKRPGASHFEPIGWDAALSTIAQSLTELDHPDQAIFYTSGRTSNEAAWLYQLLARSYGTNNLPDCSNMCHEPTSRALDDTIGIGKGTVRLADFERADAIIIVGQNPGTNHPRMLSTLEAAKQQGARIVAVNPLPEAGLLGFRNPQTVRGLVLGGTELADWHLPIKLGADQALFQLWSSMLVRRDAELGGVVDRSFIERYTTGYQELVDHLAGADEAALLAATGLDAELVNDVFQTLASAERVIICWAMGVTQHVNGVQTIAEIVNFALLGGHIGRPGAGLCPVRGHSNVQGNRTVGIWEQIQPAAIDALERRYGLDLPREDGYDTVNAIRALRDGKARAFIGLGGNFVRATPDSAVVEAAFAQTPLVVNVSTKLNRSHLVTDHTSIILPALGRTERDLRSGIPQFVTVEDSMSMVHASTGVLDPPGPEVRSEVAIVCELATRLLGDDHRVPWGDLADDYDLIREAMAETIHGFADYNRRVRVPGGFELPHPPRDDRRFPTSDGMAHFSITTPAPATQGLLLQTLRSHDQYNTTVYGHDDRYRGISGDRHVIMLSAQDIAERGLVDGDRVDIVTDLPGPERRVRDYLVVEYPTPRGAAAAYYPETNPLIPLDHHDPNVRTPASKSVPIRLERR